MRVILALVACAVALRAGGDRNVPPLADKALQARVNAAIDRGVAYLEQIQRSGGYWTGPVEAKHLMRQGDTTTIGGHTALAVYALSASGVPSEDPVMRKSLRWLLDHPEAFRGDGGAATYAISLLVLALTRTDPVAHRTAIHEYAHELVAGQKSNGRWTYTVAPFRATAPARAGDRTAWRKGSSRGLLVDNSNTQLAVLALWAAHSMADYEVPKRAWGRIAKHFRKEQRPDGGWTYRNRGQNTSATMTAAGAVSRVYALAALDPRPRGLERARKDLVVQRALRRLRLGKNAGRRGGGGASWRNYYWIYSLERVGTVLALDPQLWYLEGAAYLVEHQAKNGHWPKEGTDQVRPVPRGGFGIVDRRPPGERRYEYPYETALALLFLVRGTYPPIRGATTESDGRKAGPVTPKDELPDVTTQEGLRRLFAYYHSYDAAARERLLPRFPEAGPAAVRLCIDKLADKRREVRAAAYELLARLVARPPLFDPAATPEERAIMLVPIREFGRRPLAWDPARRVFRDRAPR